MPTLKACPPGSEGRFEKQWKWDPKKRRLENTLHGAAVQVVDMVDTATGQVAYESIVLESRRGEIDVVIREDDFHFGFVLHRRSVVISSAISSAEFEKDPMQILSVLEHGEGIEEYEISHGLARKSLEEALEEIGFEVVEGIQIGFINALPSIQSISHELFAVKVGREPSGVEREKWEEIRHVRFFPPEDVRNISTVCALTQASLWRFRCWGLAQPEDSFWCQAAKRL